MKTKTNNKNKQNTVWILTREDLSESESQITVWSDKEKAKDEMEKKVSRALLFRKRTPDELEREGDTYVKLLDTAWSINEYIVG